MKTHDVLNKTTHLLYLDMDGVLCDFNSKVKELRVGTTREDKITKLANSTGKEVFDFFRSLKPLPGGTEILKFCRSNKINFTILSAPLRGPFQKYSIIGKKDWLDQHIPGASKTAIFTSEKYLYATYKGTTNVLVDDLDKNIIPWDERGGIAIKHSDKATLQTIQELEKIFVANK